MHPPASDAEGARPHFRALAALAAAERARTGLALPELSMGMSADFPIAIQEGATLVRIGTGHLRRPPLNLNLNLIPRRSPPPPPVDRPRFFSYH